MKKVILMFLILSGYFEINMAQEKDTLNTSQITYIYKQYPEKLILNSEKSSVSPGAVIALMGGISFLVGVSQWKEAARGSGDPDYDMIESGSKFMLAGTVATTVGLLSFLLSPDKKKPEKQAYLSLQKSEGILCLGFELKF